MIWLDVILIIICVGILLTVLQIANFLVSNFRDIRKEIDYIKQEFLALKEIIKIIARN